MDLLLRSNIHLDSFDILDGDIGELADLYDTSELEGFTSQLEGRDDIKVLLLNVNPDILIAMSELSGLPGGSDMNEQLSVFADLAKVQSTVYNDYYRNLLKSAETTMRRTEEEMTFFKTDYNKSYLDFIETKLAALNTVWQEVNDKFVLFNAEHIIKKAEIEGGGAYTDDVKYYELWHGLLAVFSKLLVELDDVRYYISSSVLSTNFLLMPAERFMSEDYSGLSSPLSRFSGSAGSTRTNLSALINDRNKKQTVNGFFGELEEALFLPPGALGYPSGDVDYEIPYIAPPADTEAKKMTSADLFLTNIGLLLNNADESADGLFYGYNANLRKLALKQLNDLPYDAPPYSADDKKFVESYPGGQYRLKQAVDTYIERFAVTLTEDGSAINVDNMKPFVDIVKLSYSTKITEEIYDEYFRPYYDESERSAIEALHGRIEALDTDDKFSAINIMFGLMFPEGDTHDYTTYYNELKAAFKEYDSRVSTLASLIKGSYAYCTVLGEGLSDTEAKKIQGFIFNSKYSLNSGITQTQYLIAEGHLAREYTAPENLAGGWGYMTFVFVLSSIIILIFGIVISAGTISGEHSDGTMKLLLIRPHTRWQVLLSKFLAVSIVMIAFLAVNFLITYFLGFIWGYGGILPAMAIFNSDTVLILHPFTVNVLLYLCAFVEILIFCLISLTISTIFKSRAGAVSISMLVFFVSYILGALLSTYSWYKYVIFNNTNLFQYISSQGPAVADMNLWFSIIVNIVYVVVLGFACFFTFAKRDAT
jgi:ABC-2 type transport system permease protein